MHLEIGGLEMNMCTRQHKKTLLKRERRKSRVRRVRDVRDEVLSKSDRDI